MLLFLLNSPVYVKSCELFNSTCFGLVKEDVNAVNNGLKLRKMY